MPIPPTLYERAKSTALALIREARGDIEYRDITRALIARYDPQGRYTLAQWRGVTNSAVAEWARGADINRRPGQRVRFRRPPAGPGRGPGGGMYHYRVVIISRVPGDPIAHRTAITIDSPGPLSADELREQASLILRGQATTLTPPPPTFGYAPIPDIQIVVIGVRRT